MRYGNTLRKAAFAAATVAALAFGGAQAVASPARAKGGAPRCDPQQCAERCAREGLIGLCSGRGCYCR